MKQWLLAGAGHVVSKLQFQPSLVLNVGREGVKLVNPDMKSFTSGEAWGRGGYMNGHPKFDADPKFFI